MDQSGHEEIEKVEQLRLKLEDNIAQLRSGLQHWQGWEVEYGDLVERLEELPGDPSTKTMMKVGQSLESKLITGKELDQIIGLGDGPTRDRSKVIGILNRRIDYVQQNAQAIQKQLDASEQKLINLLESDGGGTADDDGLQIMEITEELDEDENVIKGSVSSTNEAASGVVDLLTKAGVTTDAGEDTQENLPKSRKNVKTSAKFKEHGVPQATQDSQTERVASVSPTSQDAKRVKSVSFAKDISVSAPPAHRPASPTFAELPPTPMKPKFKERWEVKEARAGRFFEGDRVIELDEDDNEIGSIPVVNPEDDSPEAIRLRSEMERYALGEMGAVVAEMNLEEGSDSDDDYVDDSDEDGSGENEYGMATQGLISEEERAAMAKLEEKLGSHFMQNMGPEKGSVDKLRDRTAVKPSTKKGVRFSKDVDIAPLPEDFKSPTLTSASTPAKPVGDNIVEKSSSAGIKSPQSDTAGKSSRFKEQFARKSSQTSVASFQAPQIPIHMQDDKDMSVTQSVPTGPLGHTHADVVVERAAQSKSGIVEDTGLDPALLKQEAAIENRRLLNKRVQLQGGFKPTAEDEDNPIVEEKDGQIKKVSRFKAARLKEAGL